MVFENFLQNFKLKLMLQVADSEIRRGASWGGIEEKDHNTNVKQAGSRKKGKNDAFSCYQALINITTSRGTAGAWRVLHCILLCSALLLSLSLSLYVWSSAILFILLSLQYVNSGTLHVSDVSAPSCHTDVNTLP